MILRRSILPAALLPVLVLALGAGSSVRAQEPSPRTPFTTPEARIFLQALETISRYHAEALSDSALWEGAIEGLLEELDDPYASVFTEDEYGEFREDNTGDYVGIGVQITQLAGSVTVTAVFRETPADRVGMIVGDRIVWVEGEDATEWTIDDARDAIRGEPGSTVNLRVNRDGFPEPIAMAITRDSVHVSAVATAHLEGNVGHIAIDRVARGAAEELDDALTELEDARAIIIDLRRNPGGYLDESLKMADLFLEPGSTLASASQRTVSGRMESQSWKATTPMRVPDKPILVLVDRYTASAAEIVTGALQDYGRAVVLGERTFGKGVVQTVYPLPEGRQLRITTGSWYTPLGRSLHRARDREGVPLPEADDSTETVVAANGRTLQGGGGIFPDLVVADDTLKTEERALQVHAAEVGVPIWVRLEEFTFGLATDAMAKGSVEPLPSSAFDPLVAELVTAGMDESVLADPVARAYLDWRGRVRYLTRAGEPGLALQVQAERDKVLAQALDLARSAPTIEEIFVRVDAMTANGEERGGSPPDPAGARPRP